ncbi:hypothetical protein KUTeg_008879 [Tegillarca granosa]|uniref:RRM domain-containing protein n=1 Tax=Tegillarca granosa TaxID=220873 RepID=A0ABQ9FAF5_TEGGR|nr:hypothetical protein KUTeg_008879 [Tegillarca granosa]
MSMTWGIEAGQGVVVTIGTDIADLVQEVHIIKDDQEDTSPMSNRRRHQGNRDNPEASSCLGVFGLSLYTQERDLREVFDRYGPIEECNVVYDRQSGRSRGFAFITFRNTDDAIEVSQRPMHRYRNRWQKDTSGLFHNRESTHTNSWCLSRQTNNVKEDMEDDGLLHHIIVEEVVGTPDLGQGQDLLVLVSFTG